MFEATERPRVFYLAAGEDLALALHRGLQSQAAQAGMSPLALAQSEIWLNTARALHGLTEAFKAQRPVLLPRLFTIDMLAHQVAPGLPPAENALRALLETATLVRHFLTRTPGFANPGAAFDLAEQALALLAEMEEEGVSPSALQGLAVEDHSGHWQKARQFLLMLAEFRARDGQALSLEARRRRVIDQLQARWTEEPPGHPILVAGSTGSRGSTLAFMRAVAHLPQGAVILAGFDPDLPREAISYLQGADAPQDHPQYRYVRFLSGLGLDPQEIAPWPGTQAPNPARNRLVSLALAPPPLTDQWVGAARSFPDGTAASAGLHLLFAPDPQAEAGAIALALRRAITEGKSAALVTPDRALARRVAHVLDRHGVSVDDSAGEPLHQTPAGRLFRLAARMVTAKPDAETLIAALKHPLAASAQGGEARFAHLQRVRQLELVLRKTNRPRPPPGDTPPDAFDLWLKALFDACDTARLDRQPAAICRAHMALVHLLRAGPEAGAETGPDHPDWQQVAETLRALAEAAEGMADIEANDYQTLFTFLLMRQQLRTPPRDAPVRIRGSYDARVMSADFLVLGALNEGTWPAVPAADPWLNRSLRRQLGLRSPDRETGLAALDFQQAMGAREVLLVRALRTSDAETVPSRWLNRLTTVLSVWPKAPLTALGDSLLADLHRLDRPNRSQPSQPAARRPAPIPPLASRVRQLSVTDFERLQRDPYAIYAKTILRLKKLEPLRAKLDARDRGIFIHRIVERFVAEAGNDPDQLTEERLQKIVSDTLAHLPFDYERTLWEATLNVIGADLVAVERDLLTSGQVLAVERAALWHIDQPSFTIKARADRIDQMPDGARIIDYKTSEPSSDRRKIGRQVEIEALMLQEGAFEGIDKRIVSAAHYLVVARGKLALKANEVKDDDHLNSVKQGVFDLINEYLDPDMSFVSRRVPQDRVTGDYDHLARFGEWFDADDPEAEVLG